MQHSGRYSVFWSIRQLRKKSVKTENWKLLRDKWRCVWKVRSSWGGIVRWWNWTGCVRHFLQNMYGCKDFLVTVDFIGSIFLSTLGTVAAFRPYGKRQSGISSYCLQWLNFSQMDEYSSNHVYLYRLHFITLYRDPDYTNKQETKQE